MLTPLEEFIHRQTTSGILLMLGAVLWVAMLQSGIHATLAGIFLAFTIPMHPKYDPVRFLSQISEMVGQIKLAYHREDNIVKNDELRSRVRALGEGVQLVQAPAQMLERKMHLPSRGSPGWL